MPAKSEAQRRLMEAVAHNAELAKRLGISQAVAREFLDKGDAKVGGHVRDAKRSGKK